MGEKKLSAVLVHVDGAKNAAARVAFAGALADDFGARLIGAASGQMAIPVYAPFGEGFVSLQPEVVEAARKQVSDQVAAAAASFRAAAGARTNVEWRASEANEPAGYLVEQARAADVVVVGRPAKGDPEDVMLGIAASDIVLSVGRPVMVVPPGVERLSGKRVVVAWKDTREARRAVIDALPFLKAAEEVIVVGAGDETPLAAVEDVAAYLKGHGVAAKPLVEALTDSHPAHALVRVAQRVNADLIVTGAFGHSRMRQWVFGGVTRDLLDHAAVPVLFIH